MLDWLKNINKEYPDFWKAYLQKFEKKPERFVVLRVVTSGPVPGKDVIFSFGAVAVINDQIVIEDAFDSVILQYKFLHDNGLSNTFLIESTSPKMTEAQAIEAFVEYIGNSILVGHRVHYYLDLINEALERTGCGRLKNEALDIEIMYRKWKDAGEKKFTLEELCADFKLQRDEKFTAPEDAYNIALMFLKLKTRLGLR